MTEIRPARILIVEDEAPIRRFLRVALEAEGHVVSEAGTAREGIAKAALELPAAMILDLGLPDADGVSVLRAVREWSALPVLVLSVRSDETGKIAALDAGAQDYVTKPFSTGELLARLRGLLRDRAGDAAPAILTLGPLTINAAEHRASLDEADIRLTRREFDLLWLLASHAGRLVTQEMALRAIWGPAHAEDSQYLRVYIRNLRAKLGDDAADPRWIFTEPGVGYRLSDH
ncbi:response regulator [Haematobacter missouriensis]|uniref:DNA-binding response regulator n=1 Tax=Haematobacter missouriensis TaxID=366616 RepID=A0A212AI55_9RHOB|nr:response regulator [Haematobacter missouriensis]OWJ77820.1 DNA-binding response regulator [Haematobacter missouriensis]OWJ81188.1 DNA-binding response regulator [Haematobacter missouriensis]